MSDPVIIGSLCAMGHEHVSFPGSDVEACPVCKLKKQMQDMAELNASDYAQWAREKEEMSALHERALKSLKVLREEVAQIDDYRTALRECVGALEDIWNMDASNTVTRKSDGYTIGEIADQALTTAKRLLGGDCKSST